MDKQIKIWIDVIEHSSHLILNQLNYNGLILDDLEALVKDMKRAQEETKKGIYPCEKCGSKIAMDITCKNCYRIEHPGDQEI